MASGYNFNEIKKFVGDDKTALKQMLQIFVDNAPVTLSELNKSFADQDTSKINYYAHKLKTSIDLLNIEKLKQAIREIENKAKSGEDTETYRSILDMVNEILPEIIESINKKIK
jgi:HPt (histidine-containing phosphotransfer) domain-containing protein